MATTAAYPPLVIAPLTNMQLTLVTIARLAMLIAFRIIYPLLPFLSANLRVDLQTVSILVSIQLLASLIGPLGGTLADTRGEQPVMCLGLALFCGGALICALSSIFAGFVLGYALIGLGVTLYQPAASAYVSTRTPYSRRAWALGILEVSWAGAALIGVAPLMVVVQNTTTVAPVYWVLFVAGVISLSLIWRLLPSTPAHASNERKPIQWSVLRTPSVLAAVVMFSSMMFAYDLYGVSQSAWLKQAFNANEAMLGQAVGVAGIGELIGVLIVITLVDRIGKRRATILGFCAAAACLACVPFTSGNWWLLLGVLLLFFSTLEFAIVSALPLISEIAPLARGTVIALTMAIGSIIRAGGSAISTPVWQSAGIMANALAAALLFVVAAGVCWKYVHEGEQ